MSIPEIPQEAVDAGVKDVGGNGWEISHNAMRSALAAALPHLRVQETPASEQPLREALERIKAELDKRSEEGEAHLFLNIHYWDLEELLTAHPARPRPVVPALAGALRESVDAARARRLGRPVVDREALGRALGMAIAALEADDLSCLQWGRCVPCPTDGPCACSGEPMAHDALIDAALALLPTEEGEGS